MARRAKRTASASRRGGRDKKKISLKIKVLISLAITIVAITLLLTGAYYGVKSYIQNDAFRAKLEDTTKNLTQSDYTRISHPLKLDDEKIVLKSMELARKDFLQGLAILGTEITFKQSALYDKKLHVTNANLDELSILIDLTKGSTPLPAIQQAERSIFDGLIPTEYRVDQIRCENANLLLANDGTLVNLSNFAMAASPKSPLSMNSWKIALRRGYIETSFELVKRCLVESANINITPEGYTLDDCRIMLSPGDIQVKAAYSNATKGWTAEIQSNKADVKHLLNESWKAKLSGELFCKALLRGNGNGITIANGRLYMQKGLVEALPLLNDVKMRNSYPYRNLVIHEASCKVTYPYTEESLNISDAWLFDDIDIQSKGKIQVKGHVIVGKDRSLGGSLLIGLPQAVVSTLSSGEESTVSQIFNAGSDETYAWLRINLSGTIDDPKQDLSIRLEQMATTYALSQADSAANTILKLIGGASSNDEDDNDNDDEADKSDSSEEAPSLFQQGSDAAKGLLESIF